MLLIGAIVPPVYQRCPRIAYQTLALRIDPYVVSATVTSERPSGDLRLGSCDLWPVSPGPLIGPMPLVTSVWVTSGWHLSDPMVTSEWLHSPWPGTSRWPLSGSRLRGFLAAPPWPLFTQCSHYSLLQWPECWARSTGDPFDMGLRHHRPPWSWDRDSG